MSPLQLSALARFRSCTGYRLIYSSRQLRKWQSSIAAAPIPKRDNSLPSNGASKQAAPPLSRLSTPNLVRNLILGSVFTSPLLYKLGIACLSWVANSKSALLNPDQNVVLRRIIRPLVYNHFCAGTDEAEVQRTIAEMKKMGYTGVILCYGKEVAIDNSMPEGSATSAREEAQDSTIEQIDLWRDGNLKTLSMIGEDDYMGVKYTGAGSAITQALVQGTEPPQRFLEALDSICKQASAQGSRIWIDAEQQVMQPNIDKWTIDLMRRYNRNGVALVSNTVQAYLKSSREIVAEHLRVAREEGWSLGLKLVRGAYIGSEIRDRIHDTKAETDACYDDIAKDLLTKTFHGFEKSNFPDVHLFLAGHNAASIRKASILARDLVLAGDICSIVRFGQLQGMADDISCELLQSSEQAHDCEGLSEKDAELRKRTAPQAYKCMTWGTVQECMQYLVRRAIENQGATERMKIGMPMLRAELKRRMMFT